jgi:hypothetical protein
MYDELTYSAKLTQIATLGIPVGVVYLFIHFFFFSFFLGGGGTVASSSQLSYRVQRSNPKTDQPKGCWVELWLLGVTLKRWGEINGLL